MALSVQPPDTERAHVWRTAGLWRSETLLDDVRRTAASDPGRAAIISWRHESRQTTQLTYGELLALTERAAGGLQHRGVTAGEVVSLQLPNWWEFIVLHLACVQLGAVTHPMSPILGRREVLTQLSAAGSRVLVVPDRHRSVSYRDLARDAAAGLPGLDHVLVAGDSRARALFESDVLAAAAGAAQPDSPCELQFTSGTSGHPKGVIHTHNSVYAGARPVATALGLTSEDTILMSATFGHQTGFLFGCCLPLMLGATTVLQDVWDPATMLELVDLHGVTWSSMPPPMILDACAAAKIRGRPATTLRGLRTSGGPIPWSLTVRTQQELGAQLLTSWGLTETGVCTMRRVGEAEGLEPTDGAPLPGVELKLGETPDAERGRELAVRGPGLFAGYLEQGAVRAAPSWFSTGDLAEDDGRGGIRITGRVKDLIIRGGENVPVAEIEALLDEHADVQEVAVVAVPDARLGERACAVVVPAQGTEPTLDGLCRTLSRAGLTRQFWPEYLVLVPELPRTSTGKIARGSLRAAAERRLSATPPSGSPRPKEAACPTP